MFPEYRKFPYKVEFNSPDIFRLSGNQRAKLQYHILAQKFPLVSMDERDKQDLEAFCTHHKAETAQRWLNRMRWNGGHEKMVTFGVSLEVRGKASGVWCYSAYLDNKSATYEGVPMTWESWAGPILEELDMARSMLTVKEGMSDEARKSFAETAYDGAVMMLYYQKGQYMTLPGEESKELKKWVYNYLHDGAAPFPYDGEISGADYNFTIDFEQDVQIVRSYELKKDMADYNQSHNAEHNKKLGRKQTEERFQNLIGDEWTTQEILAQGFSRKTLDTFVKHALIVRDKKGHYVRNFK